MRSAAPVLPEISVEQAPHEIAVIYADIARLAGIPLPALIWRHLATFPGVLEASWTALRPLYVLGWVQERAWRTVEEALDGESAGPSTSSCRAAGLGTDVVAAYRNVLRSYNRANPVNFVGVRLLIAAAVKATGAIEVPQDDGWVPPAPIDDLVAMVPVGAIPAEERRRINSIAVAKGIDRGAVVPSLYRHIVPWPALIRLIHEDLSPRVQSGELESITCRVSASLQSVASDLAAHLEPVPSLRRTPAAVEALEAFSGLIPEMVVVGGLLERGLDPKA